MKVIDFSDEPKAKAPPGSMRWWDADDMVTGDGEVSDDDIGRAMVSAARQIEQSPSEQLRYDLNLLYGSLYEGRELTSLYQYGGQWAASGNNVPIDTEVTWNVIRSVVQTVASQVSRSRPRARFITSGGNYRQKRRARKLTKFCDGVFNEARVYEKTQLAFVHAGAFDVAGVHVHAEKGRVRVDLVRACEILIDANDGIDGKPRTVYRRKYIDRGVLRALVRNIFRGAERAKRLAAVDAANVADPVGEGGRTNLVEVFEAWHLRSGEDAKDGMYVMAIAGEDGLLIKREYTRDYHELILFPLDPALAGPYGRSAAEVLLSIQVAINTQLDKIAKCQHLMAVPRTWVHTNTKVDKAQINNAPAGTYYYSGTGGPPVTATPTALNRESYDHLERHYEKAFSLYGVSAQVAAGQKEAGVTSAVAIRESLDVQTARFAVLSQRWEQLHLDIARACIDTAREIAMSKGGKYDVLAPGMAALDGISWEDVALDEAEYIIQAYPTSLLPQTPQGRIDRVTELVQSGIWSAKRAEAALDELDPDSQMKRERSAEALIERVCEDMLMDGKPFSPDVTMDLKAAVRIGAEYLNEAREDDVPEKHVDLLFRFLDDVAAIQKMIGPSPAPANAAQTAAPMPVAAAA